MFHFIQLLSHILEAVFGRVWGFLVCACLLVYRSFICFCFSKKNCTHQHIKTHRLDNEAHVCNFYFRYLKLYSDIMSCSSIFCLYIFKTFSRNIMQNWNLYELSVNRKQNIPWKLFKTYSFLEILVKIPKNQVPVEEIEFFLSKTVVIRL